jgi:hypothetical protein
MEFDNVVAEESKAESVSKASDMSKLAVLASLAVNLTGILPPTQSEQQLAAERYMQAWGDCIDE